MASVNGAPLFHGLDSMHCNVPLLTLTVALDRPNAWKHCQGRWRCKSHCMTTVYVGPTFGMPKERRVSEQRWLSSGTLSGVFLGVTEQTHGCAVLGTPCRGPVREADVVWVQISPEEVKALDAQWEELAMRSDMPVTMDDIQEVPSSHPSSPFASRYLTPRKHTLLPETWMMTRSPPRERWRSRYELQHQSTRMHHSTQNTICSVLVRYLPCLSFCVSSRV